MPRKPIKKAAKATRKRAVQPDAFARQLDALVSNPMNPEFDAIQRPAGARFEAFVAEDGSEAVIDIFDVIGSWETNARTLSNTLKNLSAKQLTVRINSPGGSVFEGFAMYNALRDYARRKNATVRTEVVGVAASIASVIAMAGDTIAIAENGFLMIHNAWAVAIGNAVEMRKIADVLDKLDTQLVATYVKRTGETAKSVAGMMAEETWLDSADAVEMNFADEIIDSVEASALAHDVTHYDNAPGVLTRPLTKAKASKSTKVAAPAKTEDWSEAMAACTRLGVTLKG